MSDWSALAFLGPVIIGSAALAAYDWVRSDKLARANRELIESGREQYFEQRRAWKAYGTTPPTNPDRIRRRAIGIIVTDVIALAVILAFWIAG